MELEHPDLPGSDAPARSQLRALARLRDRVTAAAREIERLREENVRLAERIAALQEHSDEDAVLTVESDAEATELRAKIEGFIASIDQLLDSSGEAASETPDASAAQHRDA